MAITHRFDYVKARSTGEVLEVLSRHGRGASVLAGGTDLVGLLRDDLVAPDVLVDIKGVAELDQLEIRGASPTTATMGIEVLLHDLLAHPSRVEQAGQMVQIAASRRSVGAILAGALDGCPEADVHDMR